jgi:hypothetical protein
VWWWKATNTNELLFRIFVFIELHHSFYYLLVSYRSWWYADEVEDETEKRDNKRHLCTDDIWNYQCTIEISLHLAMWTLLHSKRRSFENMLSLIAKSGTIPLYIVSGSIMFSQLCLSQNLYQNLSHNSLSIVIFSKALMDNFNSSLGVSMRRVSGGRFEMKEWQWETAKSRQWRPSGAPTTASAVNFTLHTDENIMDNFKNEQLKIAMLDSYMHNSKSISEFKRALFWSTTLRMFISHRLAKQSADNLPRNTMTNARRYCFVRTALG